MSRRRTQAKRRYTMRARATGAIATRRRIVDAAVQLFMQRPYDEVSLQMVADRAAVSLPTVMRKFRSKDALMLACADAAGSQERDARVVVPGDVRDIARVLGDRYERIIPEWRRILAVEDRFPAVARSITVVRRQHLDWLATAFAPLLPPTDDRYLHSRRLAMLFGITEIYVWWTWRTHLHLSAKQAEQTMAELLESTVASWRRA